MSILDREAKIFRFLFESAVFEREFAAEVLSTIVNFQRFKMTPFNGEGPVRSLSRWNGGVRKASACLLSATMPSWG